MRALIAGFSETPYVRQPAPDCTTEGLLAEAAIGALASAGFSMADVDGFGVSSFTVAPDHAIDLAWKMGISATWLGEDTNGGASAVGLLRSAVRAIEAGDASCILLVSGDRMDRPAFNNLVTHYNRATVEELVPVGVIGPNALFGLLTRRQMDTFGLERRDYANLVRLQRSWAGRNPNAVYRNPMSVDDYLGAPIVCDPLSRYDCVPPVSGANALLVVAADRVRQPGAIAARQFASSYNYDQQEGDGLHTGLVEVADSLWAGAGLGPTDIDVACIYDDYPAMVLAQLDDLGFIPRHDYKSYLHRLAIDEAVPAINTSGGQLSAGQAGSAGGMHGVVEACRQLAGQAADRQVESPRFALVTGYGMVLYRYGACANAVILERLN